MRFTEFKEFYLRTDPAEQDRFEDMPETVKVLGESVGCQSCCNEHDIIVTQEQVEQYILSLEKRLEKAHKILSIIAKQ